MPIRRLLHEKATTLTPLHMHRLELHLCVRVFVWKLAARCVFPLVLFFPSGGIHIHMSHGKTMWTNSHACNHASMSAYTHMSLHICVCTHAYTPERRHVGCALGCKCVRMYAATYACSYVCMYVCMYACMHACMYVCILSV